MLPLPLAERKIGGMPFRDIAMEPINDRIG